jgi:hypothetical protein
VDLLCPILRRSSSNGEILQLLYWCCKVPDLPSPSDCSLLFTWSWLRETPLLTSSPLDPSGTTLKCFFSIVSGSHSPAFPLEINITNETLTVSNALLIAWYLLRSRWPCAVLSFLNSDLCDWSDPVCHDGSVIFCFISFCESSKFLINQWRNDSNFRYCSYEPPLEANFLLVRVTIPRLDSSYKASLFRNPVHFPDTDYRLSLFQSTLYGIGPGGEFR